MNNIYNDVKVWINPGRGRDSLIVKCWLPTPKFTPLFAAALDVCGYHATVDVDFLEGWMNITPKIGSNHTRIKMRDHNFEFKAPKHSARIFYEHFGFRIGSDGLVFPEFHETSDGVLAVNLFKEQRVHLSRERKTAPRQQLDVEDAL